MENVSERYLDFAKYKVYDVIVGLTGGNCRNLYSTSLNSVTKDDKISSNVDDNIIDVEIINTA